MGSLERLPTLPVDSHTRNVTVHMTYVDNYGVCKIAMKSMSVIIEQLGDFFTISDRSPYDSCANVLCTVTCTT